MHDYRPTFEEYIMRKARTEDGYDYLVQSSDDRSKQVLSFLRHLVQSGVYSDPKWNGRAHLIDACVDWVERDEDALRYAVQHLSRGRLRQGRVEGLTH